LAIEDSIVARVNELIANGEQLSQGNEYGQARDGRHFGECKGWLGAALNIVEAVIPDPNAGYRRMAEAIAMRDHGYTIPGDVGELVALLRNLLNDAEAGLVASVADYARAEVFDNFLDHAKSYRKEGRKNEAGVIAGVVFEDSIRRVCRKHDIEERGQRLDDLISALNKCGFISGTKAKRARVAAHVRTKATHAQWDEYDDDDLQTTIEFIDEFVTRQIEE